MKAIRRGLTVFLFCMCVSTVFALGDAGKPEVNPAHLLGTWWVKHDLGSMDGYQMESDGRLVLVNHYSWFGDRWSLSGDTLTWVMFAEGQEPETARYTISRLTPELLTLSPLTENAGSHAIPLHRHAGDKATDSWTGRWTGAKGAFMDIVPAPGGYRIVIVRDGKMGEYRGTSGGDRITFTRNGVEEIIRVPGGGEPGLKLLEGKPHRLMIRGDEGYYRN